MDVLPHFHGAKRLWTSPPSMGRLAKRVWANRPWGEMSSAGRNDYGTNRPLGEMSIHVAKRPWGKSPDTEFITMHATHVRSPVYAVV